MLAKPQSRQPKREALTAVNDDGSRFVIHPADARGRFANWRRAAAALLALLYFGLPWIEVGGYPAVFLDVERVRFHFFGLTFVSQELWLAFFLISGLGFGLFYITAFLGRIWCGWACPQTVFLEHLYRPIERWIEGDAPARRQLDAAPWSATKVAKRVAKHGLFAAVALAVANLFVAYFVSLPELWRMVADGPAEHWKLFLFIIAFAAVFYFNFAWFREQTCIILCPYGRLQSALIDEHSLVIGYDEDRGEPRGKPSDPAAGDCIDCLRCVQVCPTGIDIRQGLQMECIGCSRCIDACDTVMDRLGRDRGLIRYDSQEGLAGRPTRWLRPRTLLYTALLACGAIALGLALRTIEPATLSAWRVPGSPFIMAEGTLRNQFMARLSGKTQAAESFRLELSAAHPHIQALGTADALTLNNETEIVRTIVAVLPADQYRGPVTMTLRLVDSDGQTVASRDLVFVGPDEPSAHE